MKVAIKKRLVDSLSGTRLINELILILKENRPLNCIMRMKELELLQFVSPQMMSDPLDISAMERIESILSWAEFVSLPEVPETWYVYFLALFYSLDDPSFFQAAERLQMQARLRNSLDKDRKICKESLKLLEEDKDWKPEAIYNRLSLFSVEAIIYFLAVASADRANQYANVYFTQFHNQAELSLTGDDLVEMGMKPGPVFQSVFKELRDARIKGEICSKEEEMAWVRKQFLSP